MVVWGTIHELQQLLAQSIARSQTLAALSSARSMSVAILLQKPALPQYTSAQCKGRCKDCAAAFFPRGMTPYSDWKNTDLLIYINFSLSLSLI